MGTFNPSSGSWTVPPIEVGEPSSSSYASAAAPRTAAGSPSGGQTAADHLQAWLDSAFGPTFAGVAHGLLGVARRFQTAGKLDNPWPWIGGAAAVGYILGRSAILRPIAGFAVKTALTTLLERTLRSE